MIVGVLLAAGASTRMGRPKALVSAGGESFVAHGIRHLWSACDRVVIVLGAEAPRIQRATERELERLAVAGRLGIERAKARGQTPDLLEARFVVNHDWKHGMLSSARHGLREALRSGPEAVLVLPVDHPAVRPGTVADLGRVLLGALAACRTPRERAGFSYALIPRYRRRRGHPIALSPALARAVAADSNAADLSDGIRRNARLVGYLDVRDGGIVRNRNTPRD
jgi:CTP:molybdopterin cytidylyltransferase MocA